MEAMNVQIWHIYLTESHVARLDQLMSPLLTISNESQGRAAPLSNDSTLLLARALFSSEAMLRPANVKPRTKSHDP